MNAWWSVLTTIIVNGILLFLFQQYVQFRFTKLTDALERERAYSATTYEGLSQAYKSVWKSLTDMQQFLERDLPTQFASGRVGGQWDIIYAAYASIRGEMLVLPASLVAHTEAAISELVGDINEFMAAASHAADWQRQDETLRTGTESELLRRINTTLQSAQSHFESNLRHLQEEYQATARSTVVGSVPETAAGKLGSRLAKSA